MVTPADKRAHCEQELWPSWRHTFIERKVLMLPGIMGSQLFDVRTGGGTLWVDFGFAADLRRLAFQELTPEGGIDVHEQMVLANGVVWPPIGGRPYAKFMAKLPCASFSYDWRDSIALSAAMLRRFLTRAFEGRPDKEHGCYSIVTHSMGGCVLLYLLARTDAFDRWIKQIVCVAPPFHGAVAPIRVVEYGKGVPGDVLINDRHLREAAATMPGLFQLAVAPRAQWADALPVMHRSNNSLIKLSYPIREARANLHEPLFWSEPRHPMRKQVLQLARYYHEVVWSNLPAIRERLGTRMSVIVGLNGRNTLSRVTRADDGLRFHKNGAPKQGKYANGDASVLFQSSYLPGFDTQRYWAYTPTRRRDIHSGMLNIDEVMRGVAEILDGGRPSELEPYHAFIDKIDFANEQDGEPKPFEDLDYLERARLRAVVPYTEWDAHGLRGDDGRDCELLTASSTAASRVIEGHELAREAERLGESPEFLEDYILQSLRLV